MNELDIVLEPVLYLSRCLDVYWPNNPKVQKELELVLRHRPDFVEHMCRKWSIHRKEEREILVEVGRAAGYRVTFSPEWAPILNRRGS